MARWSEIVKEWVRDDSKWILERGDTRSRLADIKLGYLKASKLSEEEQSMLYNYYLEQLTKRIGNRRGQITTYDGRIIWIGGKA